MIGFLYRIIIGHFNRCEHKWEYKGTGLRYSGGKRDLPSQVLYNLKCKKCGNFKTKRML